MKSKIMSTHIEISRTKKGLRPRMSRGGKHSLGRGARHGGGQATRLEKLQRQTRFLVPPGTSIRMDLAIDFSDLRSVRQFIQTSLKFCRQLPFLDAVEYLSGLLKMAGDDPAVADVRRAFIYLDDSARQLTLISEAQ